MKWLKISYELLYFYKRDLLAYVLMKWTILYNSRMHVSFIIHIIPLAHFRLAQKHFTLKPPRLRKARNVVVLIFKLTLCFWQFLFSEQTLNYCFTKDITKLLPESVCKIARRANKDVNAIFCSTRCCYSCSLEWHWQNGEKEWNGIPLKRMRRRSKRYVAWSNADEWSPIYRGYPQDIQYQRVLIHLSSPILSIS